MSGGDGELVYALVARGGTILAEYTNSSGNFTTVTQSILDNIPDKDYKCTYVYDNYLFHYVREDGLIYLCMGDQKFGRRIPFAFLEAIQKEFAPYKDRAKSAIAYAFNRDFSPVLKNQMQRFSKSAGADKLSQVKGDVEQVKGVMVENIEKVLQRGEQIDLLVDKTESLDMNSRMFKKNATKLRNRMWWENQRFCIIIVIILAVIITIIAISVSAKNKNKK